MNPINYAPGVAPDELRDLWSLSFEKTTRGIAIIDPKSRNVVAVNPAYAAMHGGRPGDFVGKPIDGSLTSEGVALLPRLAERLNETGFLALEGDHVRLDGSVFRAATEVMAATDEDDNLLYRICWFTDLTEKRALERQTRAAERRFETAFAKTAVGMALCGLDGHWLRANPAFCAMLGYEEEELLELTFTEVTHPDDLVANFEGDERLLAGEADDYQLEKRYLHRDGSAVWVLLSVTLDRDPDGIPSHYIVHASDISLRKQMETDFAHGSAGAELGRELMAAVGDDFRLGRLVGRWTEVLGWSEEELRARPLGELLHPDDRAGAQEALARVKVSGPTSFRARIQTRNGTSCWLLWSVAGVDADGNLLCALREGDERVAIESAFELRGEVIANMSDGVSLVTTADMRVVYANPSLEQMLGYLPGELDGGDALALMRPSNLSEDELAERAAVAARLREHGEASYEGRRLRKDGTEIWCRTMTTTFDHPRFGEVWVAVQRDVTEERRASQAAAELERAKSEFLGSVSHELRTPLTSILGYSALMRAEASGQQREQFEVIERNARRQLRLVDDLLNIARIEAGEFELSRTPLDLAELVVAETEAMRPDAEVAGLELTVAVEGGTLPVVADPDRIAQVIANLLANAIKFTPRGGRIEVRLGACSGKAWLTVDDSGPSIDPEEAPHLFEHLYRGEDAKSRQVPGFGLGLAISRSIVSAHGGHIEARAGKLGGACLEVALPVL
ncbi:MAG TPA: PAS domain S-box protein [Solirubrobacterales bacterium]|jgi:PAS domain S-box-containing protein|nr:PAS domain S-box protein [Solirubrobacterales bacterium]